MSFDELSVRRNHELDFERFDDVQRRFVSFRNVFIKFVCVPQRIIVESRDAQF